MTSNSGEMKRGTRVIDKVTGLRGIIIYAFPDGTEDEPLPWVVVRFERQLTTSRLMADLQIDDTV